MKTKSTNEIEARKSALLISLNKGLEGPLFTNSSAVIETKSISPRDFASLKWLIWPICNKSNTP